MLPALVGAQAETWRTHPRYLQLVVHRNGVVEDFSKDGEGDELEPEPGSGGTLVIRCWRRGRMITLPLHDIYGDTWGRPRYASPVPLDGDPLINHPSNIYWRTCKDLAAQQRRTGGMVCGERHPRHKLTEAQVQRIRAEVAAVASYSDVAMRFGVSRAPVGKIVRRETWRHVMRGSIWFHIATDDENLDLRTRRARALATEEGVNVKIDGILGRRFAVGQLPTAELCARAGEAVLRGRIEGAEDERQLKRVTGAQRSAPCRRLIGEEVGEHIVAPLAMGLSQLARRSAEDHVAADRVGDVEIRVRQAVRPPRAPVDLDQLRCLLPARTRHRRAHVAQQPLAVGFLALEARGEQLVFVPVGADDQRHTRGMAGADGIDGALRQRSGVEDGAEGQ